MSDLEIKQDFAEFLSYLASEKAVSVHTLNAYQSDLEEFFKYLNLKGHSAPQINLRELRDYVALLRRKGASQATLARKIASIRSFFKFLLRENRTASDPSELLNLTVKKQVLPKFLSVEQMFQLLDSVDTQTENGVRDRAILELWYATGARVTEMLSLQADSIQWESKVVKVIGKGNRERLIPISEEAHNWCARYKDLRHAWLSRQGMGSSPFFFLNRRGKPFTRQSLWKMVRAYAKSAGLPKVWPHLIRHSFATHILEGGADLRAVQELLGHRSIATTEVYTHLNIENLKQMQLKFHPRS